MSIINIMLSSVEHDKNVFVVPSDFIDKCLLDSIFEYLVCLLGDWSTSIKILSSSIPKKFFFG